MKRQYLRILMVLFGFAGLGITAKAQVLDRIVITVTHDFVVAGKTLPSGTYTVRRVNDSNEGMLVLNSFENGVSAIVMSTQVKSAAADKAQVSFQKVGDQHFLSKVETFNHVFTIPVSRVAILEALAKS